MPGRAAATLASLSRLTWKAAGEQSVFRVEFASPVKPRAFDQLLDKGYYYVDFYGVSGPDEKASWDIGHPGVRHLKRIFYADQKVLRLVFYPNEGQQSRFELEGTGRSYTIRGSKAKGASPSRKGKKIIVIDPGHGGRSLGAVTSRKIDGEIRNEKDYVLQIAKRMVPLFERSPNLACVLTRSDDTYVSLDDRIKIADRVRGDFFVSLHMNATEAAKKIARGLEVYYLSDEKKATNRQIEQLENEIGGKMEIRTSAGADVKAILASLSDDNFRQRRQESIAASMVFEQTLKREGPFRGASRGIKDAGFRVLMNSNMPSILCELGFVDNVEDATMLLQPDTQEQLAALLFNAINAYFARSDPSFTPHPVPVPKRGEGAIRWREAKGAP